MSRSGEATPPRAAPTFPPPHSAERPTADAAAADYDGIAGVYAILERLAFGHVLQQARTAFLDLVPVGARVLALGEGDGRFASALLATRPDVHVTVLDASTTMLDMTRQRVPRPARARLHTVQADVRLHEPPSESFDVVTTMFMLDQFAARRRHAFLPTYVRALVPGGTWLHADFAVPDQGWRHLRARAWLALLYRFFQATTGIDAIRLDPIEPSLRAAGLVPVTRRTWSHGLVEATAFRRSDAAGSSAL